MAPKKHAEPEHPFAHRRGPGRPKGSGTKANPQARQSSNKLRENLDSFIHGGKNSIVPQAPPAPKPRGRPPKPAQTRQTRSQAIEQDEDVEVVNPAPRAKSVKKPEIAPVDESTPGATSKSANKQRNAANTAQAPHSHSSQCATLAAEMVSGPPASVKLQAQVGFADASHPESSPIIEQNTPHTASSSSHSARLNPPPTATGQEIPATSSTSAGVSTLKNYISTWAIQREATKKEEAQQQAAFQLAIEGMGHMRDEYEAVSKNMATDIGENEGNTQLYVFRKATKDEASQTLECKGMELDYLMVNQGWVDTASLLHIGESAPENEADQGVLAGLLSSGNLAGIVRFATSEGLLDSYPSGSGGFWTNEDEDKSREALTAGKKRARTPTDGKQANVHPSSSSEQKGSERLYFVFLGYSITKAQTSGIGADPIMEKIPHTMRGHLELTNHNTMEGSIMGSRLRFKKANHLHLDLGKPCKWQEFSI
ncbi:hypothetical protein QBC44DRAFT_394492 [Cladorrhinum sp. PSN332]|nr:hypothetical protein QBC44DRAFT_394492 [Cladorrhinum sp. PSN332]